MYLDVQQVMYRLMEHVDREGGIRPWAENHGIHASVVDHFLRGQRGPAPQLLAALGLERVVLYRVVREDE